MGEPAARGARLWAHRRRKSGSASRGTAMAGRRGPAPWTPLCPPRRAPSGGSGPVSAGASPPGRFPVAAASPGGAGTGMRTGERGRLGTPASLQPRPRKCSLVWGAEPRGWRPRLGSPCAGRRVPPVRLGVGGRLVRRTQGWVAESCAEGWGWRPAARGHPRPPEPVSSTSVLSWRGCRAGVPLEVALGAPAALMTDTPVP